MDWLLQIDNRLKQLYNISFDVDLAHCDTQLLTVVKTLDECLEYLSTLKNTEE